jgi:hypothetical protein
MVSLVCEMSESYPSDAPLTIKIVREKGLSDGQLGELQGLAERAAEENTGMACAFIVAEAVKEWLIENNHEGQDGSMYSGMLFTILRGTLCVIYSTHCVIYSLCSIDVPS